ncbi:hypothetical protein N9O45_03380 [Planktomarina temperata]|nr:hypothetical protein [Planktomarina temperata]
MNKHRAEEIIISIIRETLEESGKHVSELTSASKLISGEVPLDSMELVEVCLKLEEIADENDFEFNWASANTLSQSKSIFRTIESLAEAFRDQSES